MVPVQVEILLPEFWDPASGPVFAEEGDQQRFWKLTRRFVDSLAKGTNSKNIKAVSACSFVAACALQQHEALLHACAAVLAHVVSMSSRMTSWRRSILIWVLRLC